MKKHSILALVLLGALSLGCSREIPDQVGNDGSEVGNEVIVTTTITLPDAPATRALTAAGVKTFSPGDQIALLYEYQAVTNEWYDPYIVTGPVITIEAEDICDGGKSVKIRTVLSSPKENCKIRFIYPANMVDWSESDSHEPDDDINIKYSALATQDGTLASLAADLDLAVYDGRLNGYELPGSIQLENRLAIGEFTVKDDGGNDITSSITSFTVSDGTDTYTVSRSAGPGPIYVAMKPVSNRDLRLIAIGSGGDYYIKDVTGKTLDANKMYPIGVTMAFDSRFTPLTFEAITAGAQVSFKLPSNTETGSVQYKLNDGEWTACTSETPITLDNVGDKVRFRGKNSTYFVNTSTYDYGQFSATADCYLYGNIMSLVSDYTTDENAFASNVTLTGEKTFYRLFRNNTRIKSHASKPLVLPATTLTAYCYYSMFMGCTSLTTAPVLPATTLANYCYNFMFDGCTGLTTAPALPAKTLAPCCYEQMFLGCTGLTTAPDLPATTLADCCYDFMFADCTSLITAPDLPATTLAYGCYENMFFGCTELTTAPVLPATTLAEDCYYYMFCGCTSLTTAPALPATTLADYCYNSMFSGCTELTTAPALPATKLADCCYEYMFSGCTKLSSITCLVEGDIDSNQCNSWVYGVAYTGTFTRAANSYWDRGTSGIPHGWTVVDYVAPTTP